MNHSLEKSIELANKIGEEWMLKIPIIAKDPGSIHFYCPDCNEEKVELIINEDFEYEDSYFECAFCQRKITKDELNTFNPDSSKVKQ